MDKMNKDRQIFRTPYFTDDGRFAGFEYRRFVNGRVEWVKDEWEPWVSKQDKLTPGPDEQCTGISDKNEKLIYEGDIIVFYHHTFVYNKDIEHKYVVKFGKYNQDGCNDEYGPSECIGFYADDGGKRYNSKTSILELPSEIEIIGNVHNKGQQ